MKKDASPRVGGARGRGVLGLARRGGRLGLGGRVVMITGGSRGLGLAIARVAAARGAKLALLARDELELRRAAAGLGARGATVQSFVCDVTRRGDVRDAVASAWETMGPVDVLIHDAGVIEVGPVLEMNEADFADALSTHVRAPVHFVQELVPRMVRRGGGRLVHIASVGGLVPVPHLAPYCASKFGLVGLSEALRVELARHGVVVTTVCPGLMRTGSGPAVKLKGNVRAESEWFRASALMPLLTMSAETAAQRIVRACERGDGLVVLGLPAKVLATAYRLAPGLVGRALARVNRALPLGGMRPGVQAVAAAGIALEPALLQRAESSSARAHNELGGGHERPTAG